MNHLIIRYLKQAFLILIIVLLTGRMSIAEEEGEVSPNSQQQMSEILDVLSGLTGKKTDNKTTKNLTQSIKVSDLKTAIQILQTKKDRDQVIKVLSALAYIQAENEKKQSIPGQFTDFLTSIIDTTSEFLLDSLRLIAKAPETFTQIAHNLSEKEQRQKCIEYYADSFSRLCRWSCC
ncbi:hypothetical protein [Candidatus Paracaedibacter symbiosus]|uniref:hypothetical protein n=1 Tax=Candidatus Paracaedibacter symbiosus TaxID=244582 RepID=UPI000509F8BD|nr:hypothetical protein [Candidatus Paracaedibacter symbiosus]